METGTRIPFVDLARQHELLQGELEAAMRLVLERGDFILGEDVDSFEREFASFLGVEHVVGVGSGTTALSIGIEAAGIGRGDEVIVPAHTYIASALGVAHAGARPTFCDVDERTGLIDLDSAEELVGGRTAAVMAVHLYGQACDMGVVAAFAAHHGLAVIEDAAQAHGARWDGRRVGSLGTVAAFSFYPSKNLGAFGDGGAVCTDDPEIAAAARALRNIGQSMKGEHVVAGYNERLDTLQAAILRVKLPHLERWNRLRRDAAEEYGRALPEGVPRLPRRERAEDVYHLFPVRLPARDRVAADLARDGVATGVHYDLPVHLQPPFRTNGSAPRDLERAEAWAREELSLPMYPGIAAADIDAVCRRLFVSREDRGR